MKTGRYIFEKKALVFPLVFLLALALFSCENNVTSVDSTGTGESVGIGGYFFPDATTIVGKKKSYIYYGPNGQNCGYLDTFYLDGWESVPFITFEDVCSMISLFNDRGCKVSVENGVYKYNYNQENIPAEASWPTDWNPDWYNDAMYFDPKTQTVWSDDFVRVISQTSVVNNGIGGDAVTAISKASAKNPKILPSSQTAPMKGKGRTVVRLGDYGLKMFEIGGKLYVPFQALSVVFFEIVNCVFNGDDYYIVLDVFNDENTVHKAFESGRSPSPVRSRLMTEYNYRVLCLTFDMNYCLKDQRAQVGKDNINLFNDSIFAAGLGFDLLSTDTATYDKALVRFLEYYIDDGHTSYFEPSMYQPKSAVDLYNDYRKTVLGPRYSGLGVDRRKLLNLRNAAGGKQGLFYVSDGGTEKMAVIAFDGFEMDDPSGISPGDYEKLAVANTYAFFKAAFDDIKNNHPDLKNVVFDLSLNAGGAVNQCLAALCFLEDPANFTFAQRNQLDGSVTKFKYNVTDENGASLKKSGY
ncbi:MAG: hypothetical protein IK094_00540, partial [Treponema sp.]|nr:hypothetical protein [Treponema sp.]